MKKTGKKGGITISSFVGGMRAPFNFGTQKILGSELFKYMSTYFTAGFR